MCWRGCGAGGRELVVGCIEGDVVVMESAGDDVVMVMCCRSMAMRCWCVCGTVGDNVQYRTLCRSDTMDRRMWRNAARDVEGEVAPEGIVI